MAAPAAERFDVVVVGAGLSGIGAACRLAELCPHKSFVVLEGRDDVGGTWDLWRYPGVRSDSDMFTLSYPFRPWDSDSTIAEGAAILDYIRRVAAERGVLDRVRLGCRVRRAAFGSAAASWELETTQGRITCSFLYLCTGYYQYDGGYVPEFKNIDKFRGEVLHPMHWPAGEDPAAGKRVVVIGSGATAISLVPALVKSAAHVTMLQRSPTYLADLPGREGPVFRALRGVAPAAATAAAFWRNVAKGAFYWGICRAFPETAKNMLISDVMKSVPGQDPKHFTPRYLPWTQRLCAVVDGDFFEAIRTGAASVATDRIEEFTPGGLRLESGAELEADVVIAATGFNMQRKFPMSDVEVTVDGRPYEPTEAVMYKGLMLSGVPNFAFAFGYVNASWTLRSDMGAVYVCRLLNHMEKSGFRQCCPKPPDSSVRTDVSGLEVLEAGYITRAKGTMPKTGDRAPWVARHSYVLDRLELASAISFSDGTLDFLRGHGGPAAPAARL